METSATNECLGGSYSARAVNTQGLCASRTVRQTIGNDRSARSGGDPEELASGERVLIMIPRGEQQSTGMWTNGDVEVSTQCRQRFSSVVDRDGCDVPTGWGL